MKNFLILLSFFVFLPFLAWAEDIAICGASEGYAYDAHRQMNNNKGEWSKDSISDGKLTFRKNNDGSLDLLVSSALGLSSSVEDGAQIIPATISNEAATIVLIYPNRLSETYVFQKLKNDEYQVMWTQAKAETPFPRITAFVAKCSYLNLDELK